MDTKKQLIIDQFQQAELMKEYTPIYTTGLLAMLESCLTNLDIEKAKKMFVCRAEEAHKAIKEFEPELHEIMSRDDKRRIDKPDYETHKLPRSIQRVTNNTGTFFMFGNNLRFSLSNSPEETKKLQPYFDIFMEYLKNHYFNERMYEARRITGAETECAKEYVLYKKDNESETEVLCRLHSNSKNEKLYTLFDQYDKLLAFAIGYYLRNSELELEEHFDVYTAKFIYKYHKPNISGQDGKWRMTDKQPKPNAFKKIPIIYYHHEVDWYGSQKRIEHLEWVDSKRADICEYFGDPYLLVTADVVNNRLADAQEVGKVIVMDNENGRFEFVAPPDCGDMIKDEKDDLKSSIEQDTLTPDWQYKSIMGLGTLSGEAMRRANLPGYVKRTNLAIGVYNELIRREINLILAIMCNHEYLGQPDVIAGLQKLKIEFQYSDPFMGGIEDNSTEIATRLGAGAMSIRAAVEANPHIEDKDGEYERIWEEIERKALIEARVQAKIAAEQAAANKEVEPKNE